MRGVLPLDTDVIITDGDLTLLIGGLQHVLFSHILGIIIPID